MDRIATLEREIARLSRAVEAMGRQARAGAARPVRLVITGDPEPYSHPFGESAYVHEPPLIYAFKFLDAAFNNKMPSELGSDWTEELPDLAHTERQEEPRQVGYSLRGTYVPPGTLCLAFFEHTYHNYAVGAGGGRSDRAGYWFLLPLPHMHRIQASRTSSTTITGTAVETATQIQLTEAEVAFGMTLSDGGVQVSTPGHYYCSFSAHANKRNSNGVLIQAYAEDNAGPPLIVIKSSTGKFSEMQIDNVVTEDCDCDISVASTIDAEVTQQGVSGAGIIVLNADAIVKLRGFLFNTTAVGEDIEVNNAVVCLFRID